MKTKTFLLALAAICCTSANAQLKLNGIGHNNRYDDGDQMKSEYLGWSSDLGKAIFIVDQGLYTMSWDGSSLSTPVREPEVSKSDVMSSEEKQLWATNFNMMFGNSGAAYINGKLVTVMSRDEQSTTDEELFAVRKWDAKTGDLLYNRTFPKSAMLESAGMAYNPKDGKVYGLFYITEAQLSQSITSDPEYFSDQDDADAGREGMDAGYAICTIDLQTMKVTPVTPGLYYYNFITFAINSDGRAFALTSGGSSGVVDEDGKMYNIDGNLTGAQLCEFDLETGLMKTKAVDATDPETGEPYTEYVNIYEHGTGYASQYRRQSACFDRNNPNIMYWNGYFNSGKGINDGGSWSSLSDKEWRTNGKYDTCLYAVDITTGDATRLSKIANRWIFSALWVDGNDVSDGADIDIVTEGEPDEGAYIALSTAENGGIWQQVELGKQYTYYLEPAVGWKLHSVSFNNQDVTNNVTVNSMYTTPVITLKSNSLFVAFEQTNPDIQAVRSTEAPNQTKVLGREGGVSVSGLNAGDMIQVYSLDGRLIQMVKATGARADIDLASKQLYIIKAGTKTVKVRL